MQELQSIRYLQQGLLATFSNKIIEIRARRRSIHADFSYRDYSNALLGDIAGVAEDILKLTDVQDIIIMPGRSLYQIYSFLQLEAAVNEANKRQLFVPVFSKGGLLNPEVLAEYVNTYQEASSFREYLTQLGLSPEMLAMSQGKIYLIDTILSGSGLSAFLKILTEWCHEFQFDLISKIEIWNFGHKRTQCPLAKGNLIVDGSFL